jgi:uncharacterized Zn finger protein (UPF0148 family)
MAQHLEDDCPVCGYKEEIEDQDYWNEVKENTLAQQRAKAEVIKVCHRENLPIPPDLLKEWRDTVIFNCREGVNV